MALSHHNTVPPDQAFYRSKDALTAWLAALAYIGSIGFFIMPTVQCRHRLKFANEGLRLAAQDFLRV